MGMRRLPGIPCFLSRGPCGRPEDPEIEEKFSVESDHEIDLETVDAVQEAAPKPDWALAGRAALFLAMCVALPILSVPLLLVTLFKSPESLQSVLVLGVSYQKLVFLFLLSAGLTAYVCFFFLRAGPLPVLFLFALSVFSCFPLVAGLKNNLTLHQALVGIPFFQTWPFFARPGYILFQFLIPAAILTSLVLWLKNSLGRKPYGMAFLLVALYLSTAGYFGFSALIRAGQPNLVNALSWIRAEPGQPRQPWKEEPLHPPQVEQPVENPSPGVHPSLTGAVAAEPNSPATPGLELDRKVQALSDKVDRLLEVLTQRELRSGLQQGASPALAPSSGPVNQGGKELSAKPPQEMAAPFVQTVMEPSPAEDLTIRVQAISEKVEGMLQSLTRLEAALPQRQEASALRPPSPAVPEAAQAELPVRSDSSPGTPAQAENAQEISPWKALDKRVQTLSEKLDRVLETLTTLEGLLPVKDRGPTPINPAVENH